LKGGGPSKGKVRLPGIGNTGDETPPRIATRCEQTRHRDKVLDDVKKPSCPSSAGGEEIT